MSSLGDVNEDESFSFSNSTDEFIFDKHSNSNANESNYKSLIDSIDLSKFDYENFKSFFFFKKKFQVVY